MKKQLALLGLASTFVFVLACGTGGAAPSAQPSGPPLAASEEPMASDEPMAGEEPMASHVPMASNDPMAGEEPTARGLPLETPPVDAPPTQGATFNQPWATATLTDVTMGEAFTLAGLAAAGRVVMVEPMAIWCSNCRAQQRAAVEAVQQLDPQRIQWVSLDVESTETADALGRYRTQNNFPFTYAIADRDLARALVDEFGDVALSPPSVNLIVLGTDGRVTHLLGHHSPSELIAIATDHGA